VDSARRRRTAICSSTFAIPRRPAIGKTRIDREHASRHNRAGKDYAWPFDFPR
jgi:hypothetical protein